MATHITDPNRDLTLYVPVDVSPFLAFDSLGKGRLIDLAGGVLRELIEEMELPWHFVRGQPHAAMSKEFADI